MFKTLGNAFRDKDIRKKIYLTLLALLVYRIGCFVPIPGLTVEAVSSLTESNSFFSLISSVTGGALSNGTLFALGIIPFINSFIIMQLLSLIIPALERMNHEGDAGMKKKTQITRYLAILLAAVQGIGIVISWNRGSAIEPTFGSTIVTCIAIVLILIGGSTLVMWLGERITEYGIGNGTSLIIFIGIISSLGASLGTAVMSIGDNADNIWFVLLFLVLIVLLFTFIVFVDLSERKIPVQYAKQVKGNKMYGGQTTHIPMKVNASGVMPIIFASSFLMFPQMIASFWPDSSFYAWYTKWLGIDSWVYVVVMSLLILFFAFFYSMIQFNPEDVSRNIQRYGGFVPGIRPGRPTSEYLSRINKRLTLFGAIFLAIIALVPSLILKGISDMASVSFVNAFTATGLLIVVSVALELDKQLQAQITMKHHKGFLD